MQAEINKPVFIISFDVEMAWGFIVHRQDKILRVLQNDPQKAKETIDRLLKILAVYDIPATWAIVGHLLLDPREDIQTDFQNFPQFKDGWIDWNTYLSIYRQPLYTYVELVEKILSAKLKHEIGLHSFFHIPFSKCSRDTAESEIALGINALKKWGITPKSFIFPENQINHLDVLKNNGFQIYRGKDATRYDTKQKFPLRKLNGAIDKVFVPPVFPSRNIELWEIQGSSYFFDPQMPFTLLSRTNIGLKTAIRTNRVFHIWLHPWNLLLCDSLEEDLDRFLKIVASYRNKGSLQTLTMGELAEYLNNNVFETVLRN